MKRFTRFEDLILLAIAAGLVAAWLSLWLTWTLRLVAPGSATHPRWWPVSLLPAMQLFVLAGTGLTRWVMGRRWPRQRKHALISVTGAAAVLAALSLNPLAGSPLPGLAGPGFRLVVALATVVLWWHAIHLGRGRVSHHGLSGAFSLGAVMLALLLVADSLAPRLRSSEILLPVLTFFALGLGGLALASSRRIWARPSFSGGWWAMAGALIGLILVGGLVATRVLAPGSLRAMAAALGALLDAFAFGLVLAVAPMADRAEALLGPLFPLLSRLVGQAIAFIQQAVAAVAGIFGFLLRLMALPFPQLVSPERFEQFITSPAVRASVRWTIGLSLLLAVVAIFWLAIRRWYTPSGPEMDETRDSILSRQLLRGQLARLFARRQRPPAPAAEPYLALVGPSDDARLIVRRAYRMMLEWAQALSLPRAAAQTPGVYARVLSQAVPEGSRAIDILTRAYVRARYAPDGLSLEEARLAETAAVQLHVLARRQ